MRWVYSDRSSCSGGQELDVADYVAFGENDVEILLINDAGELKSDFSIKEKQ